MKAFFLFIILLLLSSNADARNTIEVEGAIIISDFEGGPQEGAIRFNTTTNDFEGYDGIRWKSLTGRFHGDGGIFSGMVCFNGLISELVDLDPDTDIDGDGDLDKAAIVVFATDFLVRPDTDFTYSINRVGAVAAQNKLVVIMTCDDAENNPVEIHRWSGLVNIGHCETSLLVQDPSNACQ